MFLKSKQNKQREIIDAASMKEHVQKPASLSY